jgi:hypothetical protein
MVGRRPDCADFVPEDRRQLPLNVATVNLLWVLLGALRHRWCGRAGQRADVEASLQSGGGQGVLRIWAKARYSIPQNRTLSVQRVTMYILIDLASSNIKPNIEQQTGQSQKHIDTQAGLLIFAAASSRGL